MRQVAPANIVKFIESFNGQSTTGGEDHPSKCDALLHLLDRLPEDAFKSSASYAEMRAIYSRLQAYVECFKSNASVARDMYTQWLSKDIHPVRDIWRLMKSLDEISADTRQAKPMGDDDCANNDFEFNHDQSTADGIVKLAELDRTESQHARVGHAAAGTPAMLRHSINRRLKAAR